MTPWWVSAEYASRDAGTTGVPPECRRHLDCIQDSRRKSSVHGPDLREHDAHPGMAWVQTDNWADGANPIHHGVANEWGSSGGSRTRKSS